MHVYIGECNVIISTFVFFARKMHRRYLRKFVSMVPYKHQITENSHEGHSMLYLALRLTLSPANLASPLKCFCQIFSWREVNDKPMGKDEPSNKKVAKTVEEMMALIRALKNPQVY